VSGQRLGRYMKDNLLDPLGMSDTAFKIGEAQRKRLAKIHARTPDGLVSTDTEIPQEPEFEMGGGGLYSTVGDYLKFAQAILNGGALNGARALKPETVELMSKNAMGDIRCRPLKTAQPALSYDVDFLDGMSWGLSFVINPEPLPWPASSRRRFCRSSTRRPSRRCKPSRARSTGQFREVAFSRSGLRSPVRDSCQLRGSSERPAAGEGCGR